MIKFNCSMCGAVWQKQVSVLYGQNFYYKRLQGAPLDVSSPGPAMDERRQKNGRAPETKGQGRNGRKTKIIAATGKRS